MSTPTVGSPFKAAKRASTPTAAERWDNNAGVSAVHKEAIRLSGKLWGLTGETMRERMTPFLGSGEQLTLSVKKKINSVTISNLKFTKCGANPQSVSFSE